ncbi:MAG: hypothetical protein JWP97_116 [Labilithrix sp.]|nr:hypothetical protein [Labilithrix sp.]
MRRPSLLLALSLLACACGSPPPSTSPAGRTPDAAGAVAALASLEDETLRDLAALDRRVADRAHVRPTEADLQRVTMGAMLAEDPSLAVVDGAIDPFSFEARARGLAKVRAKVAAAPRTLPAAAGGAMARPALEATLLVRLVDAEAARLEEERVLPRASSALVRALIDTWQAPRNPQEAAERDRWLSRRLEDVLAALGTNAAPGDLDVVRARELDDALDALEHLIEASALGRSTAVLVRLREALEQRSNRPRGGAASDWPAVSRSLAAEVGITTAPEQLDAQLAALESDLEKQVAEAVEASHAPSDRIEAQAAPLTFPRRPPLTALRDVQGSRLRALEPPVERAAAMQGSALLATANDEIARAIALVVLHDHVTIARWALDVARGSTTLEATTARHRPRSRPTPDVIARWERIALAQPARAIGAGYGALVLFAKGPAAAAARARAWTELGDVPMDIAERELR